VFPMEDAESPSVIFKVPSASLRYMENIVTTLTRPVDITFYTVGSQSYTLHRTKRFTDLRPHTFGK
jgi:hypothetical protein